MRRSVPFILTLRWTCQACDWEVVMDAPGFAGDSHLHYPDGAHGCGPITAQKADGYPIPRDATPQASHSKACRSGATGAAPGVTAAGGESPPSQPPSRLSTGAPCKNPNGHPVPRP